MKETFNIVVGRRLRKIRKMLGISSEEMAEALELSTGHFQKLERGEHAFGLMRMNTLHEKYGIDLNYLITGSKREEDIAKDIVCGTPEERFYFMHQLLDSCKQIYAMRRTEEGEKDDKKCY